MTCPREVAVSAPPEGVVEGSRICFVDGSAPAVHVVVEQGEDGILEKATPLVTSALTNPHALQACRLRERKQKPFRVILLRPAQAEPKERRIPYA
jgi:hypothetical protein